MLTNPVRKHSASKKRVIPSPNSDLTSPRKRGEGEECAEEGQQSSSRGFGKLSPRVFAAVEEAVLVVLGRGLAARLDLALLGDHGLNRGPRRQLLEPALEVRQVAEIGALRLM